MQAAPEQDWSREAWQPDIGPKPELFFVVYGPIPENWAISTKDYRTKGIPTGVSVQAYGPASQPEIVDRFRDGYVWDEFCASDPKAASATKCQTSCIIFQGAVQDDDTLEYLRDIIGVIAWMCDQGAVSVYDPQRICWFGPDDWKRDLFDLGASPVWPHVVTLVSDEDNTRWLHTRGMIKFGRPDLSMRGVRPENRELGAQIVNRLIGFQARGGWFENGAKLRIADAPAGITVWHGGTPDDPDFNNTHLEIRWPE